MNTLLTDALRHPYLVPLAGVVLLLLVWLVYRYLYGGRKDLESVIKSIAYDHLSDLVIAKMDEGEIHIDHLLLTAEGLLVLDVKEAEGTVFGSDKMQDWTVIGSERRYTFANPQPALYDRIAAVKHIVRQVPVTGRLLFLDGANFTKGVPNLVCSLDELLSEFSDGDKTGAAARIDAFKPHWEVLRSQAKIGETFGARRRRAPIIRD
jgi:Nuclease-related domain